MHVRINALCSQINIIVYCLPQLSLNSCRVCVVHVKGREIVGGNAGGSFVAVVSEPPSV